jgi:hypothetical protein
VILLQSQPFGRRDPWAVVNHAAAVSALRAVRTVLHQLIRLSASGSRPVKDLSRRSRGESCQLGTGQRGRRVTGVELPRQRYTACGELPNLNLVGHFQDPGVTKKGHQRVCDQHAGGPVCAENRGGSGAPFMVPCRLSGGDRVGRAYAIPEVEGSSDAADENLRIRGFRYQSSRSHRYLSVELS